jgi:hypothetical protein
LCSRVEAATRLTQPHIKLDISSELKEIGLDTLLVVNEQGELIERRILDLVRGEKTLMRPIKKIPDKPIEPWFYKDLPFALFMTDAMFYATSDANGKWEENPPLYPWGLFPISPGAVVLNYGQGIFEGMKAYITAEGKIVLFRPIDNAERMRRGAERMCLNDMPVDYFMEAVRRTVLANKRWIPGLGKGTLYIRPLLIGDWACSWRAASPWLSTQYSNFLRQSSRAVFCRGTTNNKFIGYRRISSRSPW